MKVSSCSPGAIPRTYYWRHQPYRSRDRAGFDGTASFRETAVKGSVLAAAITAAALAFQGLVFPRLEPALNKLRDALIAMLPNDAYWNDNKLVLSMVP